MHRNLIFLKKEKNIFPPHAEFPLNITTHMSTSSVESAIKLYPSARDLIVINTVHTCLKKPGSNSSLTLLIGACARAANPKPDRHKILNFVQNPRIFAAEFHSSYFEAIMTFTRAARIYTGGEIPRRLLLLYT